MAARTITTHRQSYATGRVAESSRSAGHSGLAAGRLLRGRDRRPTARSDPARQHHPNLVAAVLTALLADIDNARTEGFNRIIKQVKRVGCGYRNMDNYQRRILSHIAVTRPQRSAA